MRVIRVLEQLLEWRMPPAMIRCDNGPEFISHQFIDWATNKGIRIDYIERYNRTVRYSWLSQCLFDTLGQIQDYATKWLWHYNYERPHTANQGKPPLMVT